MASDFDRRRFIQAAGITGIAGLAGCTGGPEGSSDDGSSDDGSSDDGSSDDGSSDDGSDGSGSSDDGYNVGMVYALGGLGDESFNDAAQRGIIDAAEDFDVSYDESQPADAGEFSQFQRLYAESTDPDYDLVASIGFAQLDALTETAPDFPEQNFLLVDDQLDEPNVASYQFSEEEGSFLTGALAALLTQQSFSAGAGETNTDASRIGFVGGVDAPLIRKFQAGYEAGAAYVSEDVEVSTSYVGDFTDPSGGQEAALSMIGSDVDIIYHAAGGSGVGVFQAAQDEGRFAIGVDSDQSLTEDDFDDVILASMVKRVDRAVYESVENVVNGEFEGGSQVLLGLEEEGVSCVYGNAIGDDIPQEVKDEVDSVRDEIIAGNIDVPTDPDDV
ncbi:nucleoside-binding protein [Halorubrum aidingense JCM 13560]|uniref:Nucleoside-binding protein n=1 Tax=Halorubrum aidingense JCM 13560 TaxID=1230454 RepID=M0PE39_9EURY|nr:BMP family protein [Halorubrum aidingense]EMA68133.1 nucleoside-binding protein [Halorubrum aidingense JCM 13560]